MATRVGDGFSFRLPGPLPLAAVSALVLFLAACSSGGKAAGMVSSKLSPCPATPNCVCSEAGEARSPIAPLTYSGPPEAAWAAAKEAVRRAGGTIEREEGDYLSATFRSLVFRFVDDLELRLDRAAGVIHVRSAARTGSYDFGVNRRRVEKLREALTGR